MIKNRINGLNLYLPTFVSKFQNLQNIEVERKVPAISIKLDIEEPALKGPGYQPPDLTSPPDKPIPRQPKFKKFNSKPKEKDDYPFPHHQKRLEDKFKPIKERKNGSGGTENKPKNGKNTNKRNHNPKYHKDKLSSSHPKTEAVSKNDDTHSNIEQSDDHNVVD